ncbi:YjcQ family protein [Lelliottia sp.]
MSDNGYIKGVSIVRDVDGRISWDISHPVLTMKGHD